MLGEAHTPALMILEKLDEIRARIASAARRVGRDRGDIRLVAVAKGQPAEKVVEAVEAGVTNIGENYAQELIAHVGANPRVRPNRGQTHGSAPTINWHFIGHLQRNKVKQVLPHVALIHSLDSARLALGIDAQAKLVGKNQPVLIEINLGDESSKTGIGEDRLEGLFGEIRALDHLDATGLMGIPPYHPDPEQARPFFRRLREIRDAMNRKNVYRHPLTELSMGMTSDFEVAIEEGATIVRIGTGIFGSRK